MARVKRIKSLGTSYRATAEAVQSGRYNRNNFSDSGIGAQSGGGGSKGFSASNISAKSASKAKPATPAKGKGGKGKK